MSEYNIAVERLIPSMPARIRNLPTSPDGFPVPKFVEWINGKPDFRVVDNKWLYKAWTQHLCWLCGVKLGTYMAFVIGPMCAINRTSAEPPSHLECAEFAVRACPFLTQPNRERNEHGLPNQHIEPAGVMIKRNPGVTLIWVTKQFTVIRSGDGILFKIGEPKSTQWWAHGRHATRTEIMNSIDTGLPILRGMAEKESREAAKQLEQQIKIGLQLVPTA